MWSIFLTFDAEILYSLTTIVGLLAAVSNSFYRDPPSSTFLYFILSVKEQDLVVTFHLMQGRVTLTQGLRAIADLERTHQHGHQVRSHTYSVVVMTMTAIHRPQPLSTLLTP